MIKYRTTSRSDLIDKWKELVLKYRLHFHWGESGIKEICSSNHNAYAMSMVWDDDIPVGVALVTDDKWGCNIMVYVKSKYRRQGIGTKLVKNVMRKDTTHEVYDCYTDTYRNTFYTKAGVIND